MTNEDPLDSNGWDAPTSAIADRKVGSTESDARALNLDAVGAEPGQQLRAGRAGLDVGEIEDANAF